MKSQNQEGLVGHIVDIVLVHCHDDSLYSNCYIVDVCMATQPELSQTSCHSMHIFQPSCMRQSKLKYSKFQQSDLCSNEIKPLGPLLIDTNLFAETVRPNFFGQMIRSWFEIKV